MRLPAVLFILSCLCAFSVRVGAQTKLSTPTAAERWARAAVALTNKERAKQNLPPLKWQPNLHDAAQWLARDMATRNYFSHTDKEGRDIDLRLPDVGYARYEMIGENIAAGQETPEAVVAGWMQSPEHRDNILGREWREMGAGYASAPNDKFGCYWVQDFGSRRNVYPVVINGEELETRTVNVHLFVYGEGWAQQMRLSSDGKEWTAWEPFQSLRDWKLPEGSGERTVYVEIRRADTVLQSADTIMLLPQAALQSK